MSKIELLCGMVASFKSTYAKEKAKEGWIIVNDDSIVTSLHGDYTLYNRELKPLYKAIETNIILYSVGMGKNVVIDRTSLDLETRKRYISISKMLDVQIHCVEFSIESPEIHAIRRFKSDNRGLSYEKWLSVCKGHLKNYTKPSLDEGFKSIITWK